MNFEATAEIEKHAELLPFLLLDSLLSWARTKTWKQGRHLAAAESGIKGQVFSS